MGTSHFRHQFNHLFDDYFWQWYQRFFYGSFRRRMNYIWTKWKTKNRHRKKRKGGWDNRKGRNQADSWTVDTLDCPQEQTNKRKALTRQEHKKAAMRRRAKLNLPLFCLQELQFCFLTFSIYKSISAAVDLFDWFFVGSYRLSSHARLEAFVTQTKLN